MPGSASSSVRSKVARAARSAKEPCGFPPVADTQTLYDDADLNRAIQAYRFFYPTVSGAAIFKGNRDIGIVDNKVFGYLDTKPHHVGFTLNSDTPYGPIQLDLSDGPMVVELPAGPLIGVALDVNQRWVADLGIPGPDEGRGGKHVFLPPGSTETPPSLYHVWRPSSDHLLVGARSMPTNGDVQSALARLQTIKVYPLHARPGWREPAWLDLTDVPQNTTPVSIERDFKYWEALNEVVQSEPSYEGYRDYYGELAALGISKGRPFAPDTRVRRILERAAMLGHAQLRVQSFAGRRADRVVWNDRKWEWVGLRCENGDFDAATYVDVEAREVWFYQAIGASPAMFRRQAGQGSLYWLGLRDADGNYLDGERSYRLTVPQPVPASLFWSVTVYDAETRSQISTDQNSAALRSMFELADGASAPSVDLFFSPEPPAGNETHWVKTIPGRGWFAYFRIYGPTVAAFDGGWKPGDFTAE